MNIQTAREYKARLNNFEKFIFSQYNGKIRQLDEFIEKIKTSKFDVYEILANYCIYLQDLNINARTLKQRLVTAKNFLEFNDIDISPRKFKIKIRLPKVIRRHKEALDKDDVIHILNGCSDIRLKTYVMFLACTGMRAVEALSIRLKDIDFTSNPARVLVKDE